MFIKTILASAFLLFAFIISSGQAYSQNGTTQDPNGTTGYHSMTDEGLFDSEGYDKDGYDRYGYNRKGYNRNGYDMEGFDSDGRDKNGNYRNSSSNTGDVNQGSTGTGYNEGSTNSSVFAPQAPPSNDGADNVYETYTGGKEKSQDK